MRGSQPGTMGTLMTAGSSLKRGRYVPVTCMKGYIKLLFQALHASNRVRGHCT